VLDKDRRVHLKREYEQGFPAYCGLEVKHMDPGFFEAQVWLKPEHLQQNGFAHAGLLATLADHTAGYAAYTIVPRGIHILTIEFKINFLKPAAGERIICRSRVVSSGRKIIVGESELFACRGEAEKMVSRASVTLMPVPDSELH